MPPPVQDHPLVLFMADASADPGSIPDESFWRRPTFDDFDWIRLRDGQLWAIPMVDPNRLADVPAGVIHAIADLESCPRVSAEDFEDPSGAEIVSEALRKFLEIRVRIRSLAVELVLSNYQLPRPAVEALVGGLDTDRAIVDPWSDLWLDPIGSAIETTGPESVAMVIARGASVCLN